MDISGIILGVMLQPVAEKYVPKLLDEVEKPSKKILRKGFFAIRNWSDKKIKKNLEESLFCTYNKFQKAISDGKETNPPKEEIIVPCLNAAAIYGGNEELREMFAELMVKSMLRDSQGKVLPKFVEIIKQLSPDEAKIVRKLYEIYCKTGSDAFPITDIKEMMVGNSFRYIRKNYTDIALVAECENCENISAYIDNLISLGVLIRPAKEYLADERVYDKLKNSSDILKIVSDFEKKNRGIQFENAWFCFTEYGKLFCEVCIGRDKFIFAVK